MRLRWHGLEGITVADASQLSKCNIFTSQYYSICNITLLKISNHERFQAIEEHIYANR